MFRKAAKKFRRKVASVKSPHSWAPGAAGARSHQRTRCTEVYSNIGRIVDLSPTGAGLLTEAEAFRPGMRDTIRVEAAGRIIEAGATVVWVRRESRCYRLGLRFDPLARQARAEIKALCRRLRDEELERRESAYA